MSKTPCRIVITIEDEGSEHEHKLVTLCVGNTTIVPEHPELIKNIDVENLDREKGAIDWCPSNGTFSLSWQNNVVTLECAKYGDGNGGSVVSVQRLDEEEKDMFFDCLKKWKEEIV